MEPQKTAKLPNVFKATYPNSEFEVINSENFLEWIS